MTAIQTVLLLGAGPLRMGQAGEFDYSGAQALKALREAGVRSVLVNPNIATVQTSNDLADRVYLAPVTPEFVEKIAIREKIDTWSWCNCLTSGVTGVPIARSAVALLANARLSSYSPVTRRDVTSSV